MEKPVDGADGPDPGNRVAAAGYIADLTRDLAVMARGHRLDTLGYILEMARLEAEASARRG